MICFDCQCESWPFSFLGGHSTALSPYAPTTRQTAGYAVSTDTRPAAGQDSSRRREEPRVRTPYAEPRISVPVYIFFQNIYIWNSKRFRTAMTRIIPLLFALLTVTGGKAGAVLPGSRTFAQRSGTACSVPNDSLRISTATPLLPAAAQPLYGLEAPDYTPALRNPLRMPESVPAPPRLLAHHRRPVHHSGRIHHLRRRSAMQPAPAKSQCRSQIRRIPGLSRPDACGRLPAIRPRSRLLRPLMDKDRAQLFGKNHRAALRTSSWPPSSIP